MKQKSKLYRASNSEEGRKEGENLYTMGYEAHRIAIGGHSSIRGINTLELMKAPREQRASGRNVNRDRPVSDPNHIRMYRELPRVERSKPPRSHHCRQCDQKHYSQQYSAHIDKAYT